jgi:6-phosphogluconolactonase
MKHTVISLIVFLMTVSSLLAQSGKYRLMIGTYTNTGKSQGIYSYDIDMNTAVFTQKSVVKGVSNPSYLAMTPDYKFVYSVNESPDGSAANAFSFDQKSGILTLINRSLTKSSGPCYISVTDKHVFTANYGGGSISVFGRKADGSLTDVLQVIKHVGKSINTERQNEPHVHQVIVSRDNKYVLANDLGTDKVTVYQYNPNSKTDILTSLDTLTVKLGSGPRHAVFSKDGTKLYLVQEIDGTVSELEFAKGKLSLIQETTVDRKPGTVNRAADIHLSPDEKFLYVTNRGTANDITCFSVGKDGKLEFKQQVATGGEGPRNFAITPEGKYMFVAHQFTDNVTIFSRDSKTGFLTNSGKQIKVGAPVCLVFY